MSAPAVQDVFSIVDAFDPKAFSELFSANARMVFGNGPAMTGPAEIEAGVAGFFTTIAGLSHRIVNEWASGDDRIVELEVTYRRLDGGVVAVPVVSIWHHAPDGLIDDYRVFFDLAPVYA